MEEHTVDYDEKEEVQREAHNPRSIAKVVAQKEEHNPHGLEAVQTGEHTPAVYQEEDPKAAHTADFPDRNSYCYFALAHSQV